MVSMKLRKNMDGKKSRYKSVVTTQRVENYSAPLDHLELKRNFKEEKKEDKVNSKVLETWINDTLLDAETMNIPGVILKPESKNPARRYGIDRMTL
jgi:hypothetical protein